jgi:hypothetical protein
MKSNKRRTYTAAQTRPMLSGLESHEHSRQNEAINRTTHIGSSYTLSKSLPLRLALTNDGPRAGTRYNVASNANMENPNEAYRPGSDGAGSKRGRMTNHEATGTRANRSTGERGLASTIFKLVRGCWRKVFWGSWPYVVCNGHGTTSLVIDNELHP